MHDVGLARAAPSHDVPKDASEGWKLDPAEIATWIDIPDFQIAPAR